MNSFDLDKESFDKVASEYREARPGYNPELYTSIESIKRFNKDSLILEVGAGSGIATKEIADKWKSNIIAIEPGSNLREIAKKNLKDYKNVDVVDGTFEDYINNTDHFDGIFSATAFHWIDPEVKYKKCFELLKQDGLLVLYWNNYRVGDSKIDASIQKIYAKYGFNNNTNGINERQEENIARRKKEIEDSGLFQIKRHAIFENTISYQTRRYIDLLKTFSDHTIERIPDIEFLFNEVSDLIDQNSGIIELNIKANLEIAKKT